MFSLVSLCPQGCVCCHFLSSCLVPCSFQGGGCMISLPVWLPGPMFLPGESSLSHGLSQGGSGLSNGPSQGVWSIPWSTPGGGRPPSRETLWRETPILRNTLWRENTLVLTSSGSHQSGRYASYWNAFLFDTTISCFQLTHLFLNFHIRKAESCDFFCSVKISFFATGNSAKLWKP